MSLFFSGMAAGAAEQYTKEVDRVRDRVQQQLKEARVYANEAKKREQEAAAVRTKIRNASGSYGVSEQTLFSAYRNGHLDQYLGLVDRANREAARNGTTLSPETIESFYTVPQMVVENPVDIDAEINRTFGLLGQNIDDPDVVTDDRSIGDILSTVLGVNVEGSLRGRTVQGYDYNDLMNLPDIAALEGDGGRISPDVYPVAYPPAQGRQPRSLSDGQINAVADGVSARIFAMVPNEATRDIIDRTVRERTRAFVENNAVNEETYGALINDPQAILDEFMRTAEDGTQYIWTGNTDVNGERIFYPVDPEDRMAVEANPMLESEFNGPGAEPSTVDPMDPVTPSLTGPENLTPEQVEQIPYPLRASNSNGNWALVTEGGTPVTREGENGEVEVKYENEDGMITWVPESRFGL